MKALYISIAFLTLLVGAAGCSKPSITSPTSPTPAVTVTATPTPTTTPTSIPIYTLIVSVSPSGAGSVSPPGGNYESGLQVTLTATPASGYTFDYWDGSISGSLPIVDIIINSNKSITAHFKTIDISPTTTTPVSPITTTPITPPTTAPPPIVTSNTWQLSGTLFLVNSKGISGGSVYEYVKSFYSNVGGLGSGMSYVYQNLEKHWLRMQGYNIIVLFNPSSESLEILDDWPKQYKEAFPFSVSELTGINLPFALFKRQENGLIRAIILANSETEIRAFLDVMKDKLVPVDIPWTLNNGAVTQAIVGGGWYRPMKELSDINFLVKYYDGYETDASNMLVWGEEVVGKLQNWFPDLFTIIGSRVTIIISDTGDPSHASADVTYPSLSFVSPSVAVKQSNYYNKDYYVGNIAHELGHVILDRYRKVAGGYQRNGCPNWFDEGFAEYLKFLVLGQQTFDAKYSRYRSEISSMSLNGTSEISDIYAGGSWVLRFMGDKFGTGAIVSIVKSKQSTFWLAVTEQTGLTSTQFEEQLKEWLKTQ